MFCFTTWSGKPTLDRRHSVYMIIMFYIVYHTSSNFFKRSFRCSISLINDSYNIPYVHWGRLHWFWCLLYAKMGQVHSRSSRLQPLWLVSATKWHLPAPQHVATRAGEIFKSLKSWSHRKPASSDLKKHFLILHRRSSHLNWFKHLAYFRRPRLCFPEPTKEGRILSLVSGCSTLRLC